MHLRDALVNSFPNKPWFLRVCSRILSKTLWEKEKLLVTSNFSFSHSVFYPFGELSGSFNKLEIVVCKLFQFGRVLKFAFGKGLKQRTTSSLIHMIYFVKIHPSCTVGHHFDDGYIYIVYSVR